MFSKEQAGVCYHEPMSRKGFNRKDLKVWHPTGHGKSIIDQTVLPTIMQANNVLIFPSSQCLHMATQQFDQVT